MSFESKDVGRTEKKSLLTKRVSLSSVFIGSQINSVSHVKMEFLKSQQLLKKSGEVVDADIAMEGMLTVKKFPSHR